MEQEYRWQGRQAELHGFEVKVKDRNVLQQREGSSKYHERGTVGMVAVPRQRERGRRNSETGARGRDEAVKHLREKPPAAAYLTHQSYAKRCVAGRNSEALGNSPT